MGQFAFKVANQSRSGITDIQVFNVNASEWHPDLRPDKKISGFRIAAGAERQEHLEIYKNQGHVYFNMKILFDDGSQETFRFAQACTSPFNTTIEDHQGHRDILVSRHDTTITLFIRDRPKTQELPPTEKPTTPPPSRSSVDNLLIEAKDHYINGEYHDALATINEGLHIAKGAASRNAFSDLKIKTLIKIMKQYIENAWKAGYSNTSGEANFLQAKKMSLEALAIHDDDSVKNMRHCIDLILDANAAMNLGKKAETDAKRLMRINDAYAAKMKLHDAKTQYALAEAIYHDGAMCDPGFNIGMEEAEALKNNAIQQISQLDNGRED